jgi:hypothetical protein
MTFRKGKSPNPDGRRIEAQLKRAARAEGPGCITALAAVRDNENAAPELRAQAALTLLDLAKWKWNGSGRGASASNGVPVASSPALNLKGRP